MLSSIHTLIQNTDGRYASDGELQFFQQYLATADPRLSAYRKLQVVEPYLIAEVLGHLRSQEPAIFVCEKGDLTAKWQRDTVRVLRYCAIALLLDDFTTLKEQLLLWFQTIMQAFDAQRGCLLTYATLQKMVARWLEPEELVLLLPILEEVRVLLGQPGCSDWPPAP